MNIGIGIDTGGTYTDAVIYDYSGNTVLAKGKSLTTKEDLSKGICAALDCLPKDLAQQASVVSLSTTLATNACVEGKGGRAKIVLVGTNESILRRIDAPNKYGFALEDAFCIDVTGAYDGSSIVMPDWDAFIAENEAALSEAQAFGIVEVYAERNGAVVERAGAAALEERFGVPIVTASSLVNRLNMMERGATAILNARLLPVIEDFLDAATRALEEREIHAPIMIVRSDASLMNEEFAREAPVETMVSGPAASVQGCCKLVDERNAVIVDMGGTTSDISIVEYGRPAMTDGIRIGSWRTQIKGVLIDTIGLGGDSAVDASQGVLTLCDERIEPVCVAATRWPFLLERLQALYESEVRILRPMYEALYLVREPENLAFYTDKEKALVELLRDGPTLIADQCEFEFFELMRDRVPARLEAEGIVMRCGITPTDIMHIKGDFSSYETRASLYAVRYLCEAMSLYSDLNNSVEAFCDDVYDLVKSKLFVNIVRIVLAYRYPKQFGAGIPKQLEAAFMDEWSVFAEKKREAKRASALEGDEAHEASAFEASARTLAGDALGMRFTLGAPLVGVGAPIHVFLPDVAEALGTTGVVPENAEVANAIGAAVASVNAQVAVRVIAKWSSGGIDAYVVTSEKERIEYLTKDEAVAVAKEIAVREAQELARKRGIDGPLKVTVTTSDDNRQAKGERLYLSSTIIATASKE